MLSPDSSFSSIVGSPSSACASATMTTRWFLHPPAEDFRKRSISLRSDASIVLKSINPSQQSIIPNTTSSTCANCNTHAKMRCMRCKHTWYCTAECQKAHWKHHKSECKAALDKNTCCFELPVKETNESDDPLHIIPPSIRSRTILLPIAAATLHNPHCNACACSESTSKHAGCILRPFTLVAHAPVEEIVELSNSTDKWKGKWMSTIRMSDLSCGAPMCNPLGRDVYSVTWMVHAMSHENWMPNVPSVLRINERIGRVVWMVEDTDICWILLDEDIDLDPTRFASIPLSGNRIRHSSTTIKKASLVSTPLDWTLLDRKTCFGQSQLLREKHETYPSFLQWESVPNDWKPCMDEISEGIHRRRRVLRCDCHFHPETVQLAGQPWMLQARRTLSASPTLESSSSPSSSNALVDAQQNTNSNTRNQRVAILKLGMKTISLGTSHLAHTIVELYRNYSTSGDFQHMGQLTRLLRKTAECTPTIDFSAINLLQEVASAALNREANKTWRCMHLVKAVLSVLPKSVSTEKMSAIERLWQDRYELLCIAAAKQFPSKEELDDACLDFTAATKPAANDIVELKRSIQI